MLPRLQWIWAISAFGLVALISQTVLVRELLVVYGGNEIAFGIIYGCWFLGIVSGAFLATAVFTDKKPENVFVLGLTGLSLAPILALILARASRVLLALPQGEYASFGYLALGTGITVIPAAVLIGLLFPVACNAAGSKRLFGDRAFYIILATEAAGSLLGGLLFTYVLINHLTGVGQVWFCALFGLTGAVIAALTAKYFPGRVVSILALSIVIIGSFINWPAGLDQLTGNLQARGISANNADYQKLETPYQALTVFRQSRSRAGSGSQPFDLFANGQYLLSFPDDYGLGHLARFVICQHPRQQKILILGPAGEAMAQYMSPHNLERIDLVDLDEKLHRLMKNFTSDQKSADAALKSVKVIDRDPRSYVRESKEIYDLVWINNGGPTTVAGNRMYTLEFYGDLKKRLGESGIVGLSLAGSANYLGPERLQYIGSIYKTLSEVFAHILVIPGDTVYLFAANADDVLTDRPEVLIDRYQNRRTDEDDFSADVFYSWLDSPRIGELTESLKSGAWRLNTDLRPVTYFYNLVLWDRLAGGHLEPLFRKLNGPANKPFWSAVAFISVLTLIAVFWLLRRSRAKVGLRLVIGGSALTTGLAAFSLSLILLFGFQNRFGTLYRELGLLVAVFMAGLSFGAIFAERMRQRISSLWLALLPELLIVLSALMIRFLLSQDQAGVGLYLAANAWIGLLAGLQLAGLSRLLAKEAGQSLFRLSAGLDRADHLGAMLGALLTGLVLVPLLGLIGACWLIALVKLFSLALFISTFTGQKRTA